MLSFLDSSTFLLQNQPLLLPFIPSFLLLLTQFRIMSKCSITTHLYLSYSLCSSFIKNDRYLFIFLPLHFFLLIPIMFSLHLSISLSIATNLSSLFQLYTFHVPIFSLSLSVFSPVALIVISPFSLVSSFNWLLNGTLLRHPW